MGIFSFNVYNIQGAKSGIFKTVGDMVRNKPEQLLNDIGKITDRLTDDQSKSKLFAFPYVSISLAYINFLIFPISSFSQLDLKIKSYLQRTSEKIKRLV